jgi:hypothetical protein
VARALAYDLADLTEKPRLAIGLCGGVHHAWVVVGQTICDPTADQFGQPLPWITHGRDDRYLPSLAIDVIASDRGCWAEEERHRLRGTPDSASCFGSGARDILAMRYVRDVIGRPVVSKAQLMV